MQSLWFLHQFAILAKVYEWYAEPVHFPLRHVFVQCETISANVLLQKWFIDFLALDKINFGNNRWCKDTMSLSSMKMSFTHLQNPMSHFSTRD